MGHGASYYWKGKIPSAVFYTAVPFGMTAQEMNGWLHYGGGLELWRELYALLVCDRLRVGLLAFRWRAGSTASSSRPKTSRLKNAYSRSRR